MNLVTTGESHSTQKINQRVGGATLGALWFWPRDHVVQLCGSGQGPLREVPHSPRWESSKKMCNTIGKFPFFFQSCFSPSPRSINWESYLICCSLEISPSCVLLFHSLLAYILDILDQRLVHIHSSFKFMLLAILTIQNMQIFF